MLNFPHNSTIHPWIGTGGGTGPRTPALVSSGVSGSTAGTAPVTINTTGATLLTAVLSSVVTTQSISDAVGGQSNAWNFLPQQNTTNGNWTQIVYAFAKTGGGPLQTGTSHVFTPSGTDAVIAVFAFSGTLTTSAVFDSANGATNLVSPFQPGSITPTAGDLVVSGIGSQNSSITGLSVNSGFTGLLAQTNGASVEPVAAAYLLNAANSPLNPTWTDSRAISGSTSGDSCVIACFK